MASESPLLSLSNVSASYGRVQTLFDVDLDLSSGKSLGILGANGAGKTTFLRALSGVMVRRSGTIRFAGKDISTLAPHDIVALGLGHVPEGKRLFGPLTVAENLDIGSLPLQKLGRGKEAGEARELVERLFPILRERSGQAANTLSGGEQQMLAIGRALMARPKLLVLDEPSVGLAPKVNETLFRALAQLKEYGVTIIVAEQLVRLACDLADDVIVLHLGRVALRGASRDVRDNPELKRLYLG